MRPYHRRTARPARLIATALVVRDGRLLLAQLAKGRLAGFWLLPSAMVEEGTVADTAWKMLPERTGVTPAAQVLNRVQEEPHAGALAVRFLFAVQAADWDAPHRDGEIARVGWFTREDARELLAERELVPTLGVLHAVRAWADAVELPTMKTLTEDVSCPCGSGFNYRGCCGWDAR